PRRILGFVLCVEPWQPEPPTEAFEMHERCGAFAERDRTRRHGQQGIESPEPARGAAERLARDAGERREIVLDAEVHGDALRAAVRAAGEETRLVEARAAAQTGESDHARPGAHGGR